MYKRQANKATNAPNGQTDKPQAAEPTEKPETPAVSSGGFIWPLPVSGKITSYFGGRTSPTAGASSNHQGIDTVSYTHLVYEQKCIICIVTCRAYRKAQG